MGKFEIWNKNPDLLESDEELDRSEKESIEIGDPGIEENIRPLVMCLRAYGFNVTGSCEGHFEGGSVEYPYVLICVEYRGINDNIKYQKAEYNKMRDDWDHNIYKFYDLVRNYNKEYPNYNIDISDKKEDYMLVVHFKGQDLNESRNVVSTFNEFLRKKL